MSFSKSQRAATAANAGALLREWRTARRMSQLELALEAEVSTRYLSCVETGRSQPSREMITRLAETLAMPLRERNALLMAAGYAPSYPETGLGTTGLAQVRRAIELILEHQEPYPAFVLNRHWDVIQTNPAAVRIAEFLIGGSAHTNMVRQFFDPNDLRRVVANWEEVAGDLIRHLHHALAAIPFDTKTRTLLEDVLRYPDVPSQWRGREWTAPPPPVLTVEFRKDNQVLRFFSTITTFGTSRDVTIDELRIECTFPADDSTAERCRALAGVHP
jgi:transcriptional regulator with XRE-family HTH domain